MSAPLTGRLVVRVQDYLVFLDTSAIFEHKILFHIKLMLNTLAIRRYINIDVIVKERRMISINTLGFC